MTVLAVEPKHRPPLDPGFSPAALWNAAYRAAAAAHPRREPLIVALSRGDGTACREESRLLPHDGDGARLNRIYVDHLVKRLLWTRGGTRVFLSGEAPLAEEIARRFGNGGRHAFDAELMRKIYLEPLTFRHGPASDAPPAADAGLDLGGHLDGCRVGFDLGGSDRKCAAVVEGEVVHSEEVAWDPYFQSDPRYHFDGVMDSIRRAAAHLPRLDAVGGSAAGVYVDGEPRVGSLFRGVPEAEFDTEIRPLFRRVRAACGGVPLEVANDGEVTALAASMSLGDRAVLGISMGTSLAAGYCDRRGRITRWLNELAFVPVDYAPDAAVDEWSGDRGCGVQYLSQQAVARLAPAAGIELTPGTPPAERLAAVQELMDRGDPRARSVFDTLGVYLGYSIAAWAEWYELRSLLVVGRVSSGAGGERILERAGEVLRDELPEVAERIRLTTPDERMKRHGQAIAAASLPALGVAGGAVEEEG